MYDVPVVEVSHEGETHERKDEQEQFAAVGLLLNLVELWPKNVVDPQNDRKGQVWGCQVKNEALFVSCWKIKNYKHQENGSKMENDFISKQLSYKPFSV
jgi:hypothetical protein